MTKQDILRQVLTCGDEIQAHFRTMNEMKETSQALGYIPDDYDTTMLPPEFAGKIESDQALRDGISAYFALAAGLSGSQVAADAQAPAKFAGVRLMLETA